MKTSILKQRISNAIRFQEPQNLISGKQTDCKRTIFKDTYLGLGDSVLEGTAYYIHEVKDLLKKHSNIFLDVQKNETNVVLSLGYFA